MFQFYEERVAFKGIIGEVEGFEEGACDTVFKVPVGLVNLFYCRLSIDEFELAMSVALIWDELKLNHK